MDTFRPKYFPLVEIGIAAMVVLLPLANSPELMNGIQTAKSFNFFYAILALMGIASLGFLFKKDKLKLNVTLIDVLFFAFVAWVSLNKYLLHDIHALSLRYFELLGLSILYIVLRSINQKFHTLLLVAICISGLVQAIYGNLQLWGYYPSHHGLFKMTGSFFNPGPYAGFLCCVFPVALGLYWRHKDYKLQVASFKILISGFRFQVSGSLWSKHITKSINTTHNKQSTIYDRNRDGEAQPESKSIEDWRSQTSNLQPVTSIEPAIYNLNRTVVEIGKAQPETSNLKPVIIKYISLITLVAILLVLPAARSRAAWLGAIAGVAFLVWHKYNLNQFFKQARQIAKPSNMSEANFKPSNGFTFKLFKRVITLRNRTILAVLALVLVTGSLSLYHYKKDSADGRMLIWTVTANIIKDYPMLGVGQDLFKAHYMNYQADYFRNHPNSKYETVADDNQYAFNEPLNVWVENGVIGFMLVGCLFLAVFCFRFQVTGSLWSKYISKSINTTQNQQASIYDRNGDGEAQPATCNLQPEITFESVTSNLNRSEAIHDEVRDGEAQPATCNLQPEIIIKTSLLAILIFGLFAYPSEILPIKIIAIICLGLLANCNALNNSNLQTQSIKLFKREASNSEVSNLQTQSIKREVSNISNSEASNSIASNFSNSLASNLQTRSIKREASNGFAFKPSNPQTFLKLTLAGLTLLLTLGAYTKTTELRHAYTIWNDAFELYNYGLYTECLEDYVKAYPLLQYNGEYLINYGKALSIAEKHTEATKILEEAKNYQTNTVLYTAMGDSQKALKQNANAERNYMQASEIAPGKFYPQYLLSKLYDETGQQQKAVEMSTSLLKKTVKVESTAIKEIHDEMEKIIERNAKSDSLNIENTNNGQKGRNNHTSPQKTVMVALPTDSSINQDSIINGTIKNGKEVR